MYNDVLNSPFTVGAPRGVRGLRSTEEILELLAGRQPATSTGPGRGGGAPHVRLRDYGLAFGDIAGDAVGEQFGGSMPDVEDPDRRGTWSVTDIRFAGPRDLRMHVTVEPPAPRLPVEAGPAMLFVGLYLNGGFGGDVGYQRLVSVQHVGLPACTDDACRFEANISVDVSRLPRIARSVDGLHAGTAAIGFSLVRTFAAGTWLQVIDANDELDRPGWSGTLSEPEPWVGRAEPFGLFRASDSRGGTGPNRKPYRYAPVVEAFRASVDDPSRPAPSTAVRVLSSFNGCDEPMSSPVQTSDGDTVTIGVGRHYIDGTADLPIGTTWRLGWDPAPGATFTVGADPLLIAATYSCSNELGVRSTDVTIARVIP